MMTERLEPLWKGFDSGRCCCCQGSQSEVVAVSPETGGTWDVSEYQNKKFPKFRGKYWDIFQRDGDVLARGRVDSKGFLTDLPSSVDLDENKENGILRIRCAPMCGDGGYPGRVIAGNAGKPVWDLTPYKNVGHDGETANWFIRRPGCSGGQTIHLSGAVDGGQLLDLPDEFETNGYVELIVGCGECVETLLASGSSHILYLSMEEAKEMMFPPGRCVGYTMIGGVAGSGTVLTDGTNPFENFDPTRYPAVCLVIFPPYVCIQPDFPRCSVSLRWTRLPVSLSGEWAYKGFSNTPSGPYHEWRFSGEVDISPVVSYVNEKAAPGSPVRFAVQAAAFPSMGYRLFLWCNVPYDPSLSLCRNSYSKEDPLPSSPLVAAQACDFRAERGDVRGIVGTFCNAAGDALEKASWRAGHEEPTLSYKTDDFFGAFSYDQNAGDYLQPYSEAFIAVQYYALPE